jgi:hypothetical protein
MPGFTLPYWLWPGDDRPLEEIEDEVREELALHLTLLTERLRSEGLDPATAERVAAERFGDVETITRDCRKIQQGDRPMLKRLQAVLTVLLVLGVGAVGWQQWRTSRLMNQIDDRLEELIATAPFSPSMGPVTDNSGPPRSGWRPSMVSRGKFRQTPLVIRVVDESGRPVPEANLLFDMGSTKPGEEVLSSGGTTNKQGVHQSPLTGHSSFVVFGATAGAPGFVPMHKRRDTQRPEEIVITLPKPNPTRLAFKHPDGSPIPRVRITPTKRIGTDGAVVPFTAIEPTPSEKADDDGKVTIAWFARGDEAYIEAKLPLDGSIYTASFEVLGDEATEIEVTLEREPSGMSGGGMF